MHEVRFSIPSRKLGKSDIEFKVKKNGSLVGTLKISKGSMVWFPKDTTWGYKVSWNKFNSYMTNLKKFEKR